MNLESKLDTWRSMDNQEVPLLLSCNLWTAEINISSEGWKCNESRRKTCIGNYYLQSRTKYSALIVRHCEKAITVEDKYIIIGIAIFFKNSRMNSSARGVNAWSLFYCSDQWCIYRRSVTWRKKINSNKIEIQRVTSFFVMQAMSLICDLCDGRNEDMFLTSPLTLTKHVYVITCECVMLT